MSGLELTIVLIWLTVLGGTIGSFLNVVVYRLPAGMSLSQPGSHCPRCGHAIRWYDNVPVLGWLWLRGKCRDCHTPIASRYPLVEAATAWIFFVLGVVVLVSQGANLPLRPVPADGAVLWFPWTGMQLALLLVYHLTLLATLVPMALIEYDGHAIPARLVAPLLVVGLVLPLVWPEVHPVPAWRPGEWAGLWDSLAGLGLGMVLGYLRERLAGAARTCGLLWGPAGVGLILGWQTALVVILVAGLLDLLARGMARLLRAERCFPFSGWLLVVGMLMLLCWRSLLPVLPM